MPTLSLCMIVKNEQDTLDTCLSSVKEAVDEIIIVDTGSTDTTKNIAYRYTDKVYDFAWEDDFAAARNFAFSKASSDYIIWLDADDYISPENLEKLLNLKNKVLNGKIKQIAANYDVAFDENGNPALTYKRERIFLRKANMQWIGAVHEVIPLLADAYYSDFTVIHKKVHPTPKGRNLAIYEKLIRSGAKLDARQQFYYARELYYNAEYEKAAEKFNKFLLNPDGWLENKISACLDLSRCYAKLNDKETAISSLLKSFEYDSPRAEHCCELGNLFLEKNKLDQAIFWYITAMRSIKDTSNGGFVSPECYGYIPCIQLCVCYDRKGNHISAYRYNEAAAKYKPDSSSVKYNREYFKSIGIE